MQPRRGTVLTPITFPLLHALLLTTAEESPSPNRPPQWNNDYGDEVHVRVGEQVVVSVSVTDPDDDAITITPTNLPPGAHVIHQDKSSITVRYTAGAADVGPREIDFAASDGRQTITRTVRVLVRDDWNSYFMPGVHYATLAPMDRQAWGMFHGVSTEILLVSWIHRNDNRGPSHGRVYVDMDVLQSSRPGTSAAFDIALGFDLSLERNPVRHFLLPYFGMTGGWFVQRDLDGGNVAHLTPLGGVYLWADKNVFVTASGGYMLPLSGERFADLRGFRGTAGLNFSLW